MHYNHCHRATAHLQLNIYNIYIIFIYIKNNGCTNAPLCYAIRILPALFYMLARLPG
jgi:hypothetical protein